MNPFPLHTGQRIVDEPGFGRLRVVGAVRLSKYTDASTSPEVQTELIADTAAAVGGDIVGWANDVDISALKTTPWEREQLSYWLNNPDLWDVLTWQRMDRAVRSMADMADLGRFAKQHGKRLIFASGPGGGRLELDFSSPMSELIMLILAFAAQLEGQTIMERNKGAAAHLQSLGRWAGGIIPYGTIPVRKTFPDGNEGWWLARDADLTWNHIVEMVGLGIAGEAYTAIRDHLAETGVITPKNHRARLATPPRDFDPESRWRDTTVRDILLSSALRGYLVREDGTIVRDNKGDPVMQGEPLIDDETWFRLQEALKERSAPNAGASKRKDAHPLLEIVECDECDHNMYAGWVTERKKSPRLGKALVDALRSEGRDFAKDGDHVTVTAGGETLTFPYKMSAGELRDAWTALELAADITPVMATCQRHLFRCKGEDHADGVPAPNIPVEPTLEWVDAEFMRRLGRFRRTEIVKTGGIDNRPAIQELRADIEALTKQMLKLRGAAQDAAADQLNGMSDTLAGLEKVPYRAPEERIVQLDRTWGDDWKSAEWSERRQMLISAGVKIRVGPPTGWRRPVGERLTFLVGEHIDPVEDAEAEALHQAML
ncbi:recombinase family protein [Streptomyces malaysiensis subsp. malaysiensis]|uniref:Recombinase family protein n=1 Tax=Streptomyces malaysiensis TaxID=92644 RepID=A0ABX6W5P0_STRMQ|nr:MULTISPECIES: recombinase family protein [Streptomyces]QPI56371.1 recombinase family protein [Streptomyces solisilvae]UHH17858.1 recombinase family protein [Streptomyces sp. HNM0561]